MTAVETVLLLWYVIAIGALVLVISRIAMYEVFGV